MLAEHSGANKGKMLASLDANLSDWDNPIAGASKFKQQVHNLIDAGHLQSPIDLMHVSILGHIHECL